MSKPRRLMIATRQALLALGVDRSELSGHFGPFRVECGEDGMVILGGAQPRRRKVRTRLPRRGPAREGRR